MLICGLKSACCHIKAGCELTAGVLRRRLPGKQGAWVAVSVSTWAILRAIRQLDVDVVTHVAHEVQSHSDRAAQRLT